jgi:uncharacterized protein (DUF1501 family)
MPTRREFLSYVAGGTAALAAALPRGAGRTAAAAADRDDRALLILELNGGNDGLNMVVPYAADVYHRSRPTLRIKPAEVLKLNDRVGLHPKMAALRGLYDKGEVAIIQGVGYPNPVRSHFRSMEIWQSGVVDSTSARGWLGRAAEVRPTLHACYVADKAPLALAQRGRVPLGVPRDASFVLRPGAVLPTEIPAGADPLVSEIARCMQSAGLVARELAKFGGALPELHPDAVGDWIKLLRLLLQMDPPLNIVYFSIPGFDTHRYQQYIHQELLGGISEAIGKIMNLLRGTPLGDRLLILVSSEFGRRLAENASAGTDHGTAAPMLLVGRKIRGGLYGSLPNLADLDDVGDPKFTTDFRDVYTAVLRDWLAVDPARVLPGRSPLPLLKT